MDAELGHWVVLGMYVGPPTTSYLKSQRIMAAPNPQNSTGPRFCEHPSGRFVVSWTEKDKELLKAVLSHFWVKLWTPLLWEEPQQPTSDLMVGEANMSRLKQVAEYYNDHITEYELYVKAQLILVTEQDVRAIIEHVSKNPNLGKNHWISLPDGSIPVGTTPSVAELRQLMMPIEDAKSAKLAAEG
ncbi:hypothetical protein HYALB_00010290 [Hymenoscyphus albidus]|uniref:Uncharacterized protein n=1 Tax=Hymenoscyphus albidus TaxID=595503 RepID=A0A9N9LVI2_9HELO|nr:hypothetical protein HYALB_00010290 [Hymenoscyphus albidus]